ncbi:MAG: hypothetical protein MR270_00270, partial [Erysipelotrichaceae bacterium]|nr:hypothetical protein [Erysipelotrichaceae bacterium]
MKKKHLSSILVVALGLFAFQGEIPSVNAKASETKTFVAADYTVANENWALTTVDTKGFIQENGQLTLQTGEYDAAAYGAWLTYEVK